MKNHAPLHSSRLVRSLIPISEGISVEQVEQSAHTIHIKLRTVAPAARCPHAPCLAAGFTAATLERCLERCLTYRGVRSSFGSICIPASSSVWLAPVNAASSLNACQQLQPHMPGV